MRGSGQDSVPQKKFKEVSRLAVALRGSAAGPVLSPETPISDGFSFFFYSFVERQEPPKPSHAPVSPERQELRGHLEWGWQIQKP